MDHKLRNKYKVPETDATKLSDITYTLQDDFNNFNCCKGLEEWNLEGFSENVSLPNEANKSVRIYGEGSFISKSFEPISGKLVVSLWVRMDNNTRGVNIVTLYGSNTQNKSSKLIQLDTEGAFFYAYDGMTKKKLCHYSSDNWYCIYITIDTVSGTFSLYIDGERQLNNSMCMQQLWSVSSISMGSHGGILYVNRLHIYRNPIQSVYEAAKECPIFDVKQLGVKSDGETVVTESLQKLIDQCSNLGGGVVYLKGGTYLSGCIEMKKNVTLYIERDAVLKGVLDIDAYSTKVSKGHPNWNMLVQGPQKSLIYGDTQENIRIMGGGTIDGSGDFPGPYGSESLRVCTILLVGCDNAVICDLYVTDAGMWTIPVVECDSLYIRDLNVYSCWYPNRDGIDICDCYDVLIENCNLKSDDDTVCFKSGNESGCDNVVVRNTFIISTMANGIKFGTYSYGGFTNCLCEDCIIKDTRTCAICIQSVDGGFIKNLRFRRITIQNVESVFFVLIGDKGRTPDWGQHRIGSIDEIYFENIEAENIRRSYGTYLGGFEKDGIRYSIKNIFFNNVNVIYQGNVKEVPPIPDEFANQYPESNCFGVLPASGYFIRHADNIVFDDCQTLISLLDVRQVFAVVDSTGVVVNGVEID